MDTTANKILELLYDREEFFPLEELAVAAGVTNRKLLNAIGRLGQRGHVIENSPFGLRLMRPVRLDAHLIERNLKSNRIGKNVICFDEVGSTNDVAFDAVKRGGSGRHAYDVCKHASKADGLVVLAELQKKGRGRLGRRWLSPKGSNILMSVLLVDSEERLDHEALTIAAGLALAEGIERATGLSCQLKWPNDVLLDGVKVCGVLVEIRSVEGVRCIVIGAGVNVNVAPPRDDVDAPATCLADHAGGPVERSPVVRAVIERLDYWVEKVEHQNLSGLRKSWLARCGMINQRIAAVCSGRRCVGRVADIDPLKGLVLLCDSGKPVHLKARTSSIEK